MAAITPFIAGRAARIFALLTAVFALATLPLAARAEGREAGPAAVVVALAQEAAAVLKETRPGTSDRYERLSQLIARTCDIPAIAQFVAGRFWPSASEVERQRFTAALGEHVAALLAARFARYTRHSLAVTGARAEADGGATISSSVLEANATPGERVEWRVAATPAGYRIIDVSVSGISVARAKREEFGALLARNGGRIAPLTAALETRNAIQTQSAARPQE